VSSGVARRATIELRVVLRHGAWPLTTRPTPLGLPIISSLPFAAPTPKTSLCRAVCHAMWFTVHPTPKKLICAERRPLRGQSQVVGRRGSDHRCAGGPGRTTFFTCCWALIA
jgi:hypothetical protein